MTCKGGGGVVRSKGRGVVRGKGGGGAGEWPKVKEEGSGQKQGKGE